ncbi:AbrB domain-containing protein [Desulfonema limicola]|uniref:AbrB domain-containing protein n=1 Tax=Desulfonema limicola TaxID=45656 RepID=A0A975B3V7_9BACT|nr:AbrB/MazE/SpoVT family DNA-binding domain-containing protein [Desulfonema limicola]QTA78276.1 AbrB domain-containing protein [Desulfonema limicola]
MEQIIRIRDIKLISIGNSKGVCIPKSLLKKYNFNDSLLLEETDNGLLLRSKNNKKLSWEDTYKSMAVEKEDWSDFDISISDGLGHEEF